MAYQGLTTKAFLIVPPPGGGKGACGDSPFNELIFNDSKINLITFGEIIRAFVRLVYPFVRLDCAFVELVISFVRLVYPFVRLDCAFVRLV